jgi:hypothetical protein
MEKPMTEQESLRLITDMIQKARAGRFHEGGDGAILWGSVVGTAGLMSFFERLFDWNSPFDWWLLTLFALIPQYFLARAQSKKKRVKSHEELALDTVWLVFGISIFCVVIYGNVIPFTATQNLKELGLELFEKNIATGEIKPFTIYAPSFASLMMVIYCFPTLVTGIVLKFRPMFIGALLCYGLFILSLFTNSMYDQLLSGIAGIVNWLIPGIILRSRYKSRNK